MTRPTAPLRRFFSLVALALAAGVAACGGGGGSPAPGDAASPARTRRVVVHSPHGQEILDEFESLFEAAHPDIDFVGKFVSPADVVAQLRIDKARPTIDVWWGGTSAFFDRAAAEGLLEPYEPTWSAASRPGHHDPQHRWYAQFVQVPAVMFNDAILSAEDVPGTWDELLDPKWRDRIVIREPMDSGTMKTIFTGLVWRATDESRDPAAGYEFLRKLDAQTRKYLPNPQALYDQIAKSPEGYVSLWNLTDIVFQKEANGYPFGWRVPSDPVPLSVDPIAIVAGAPNLAEAKLFYEFATSLESCARLAKDHFRFLARTDAPADAAPEAIREARYTPMEFDPSEFDARQAEWMDHWMRSIRDPGK